MMLQMRWVMAVVFLGALMADSGPVADPRPVSGPLIPNFRLLDHRGISHELYRIREPRFVVLFVAGNGCPIVRHSIPELKALRERFGSQGVEFLLLNANPHDSREEVAEEAREFGVEFPVLLDPSQTVARALELRRTAEVLVLETGSWILHYRGAVDDRLDYGQQKPAATQRYLADALAALVAGRSVPTPRSTARGCVVRWTAPASVEYVRDIAPIIVSRCVGCHSRGQVAPFAFDRFEKVRGHAGTLREVLLEDRMPPWHADPHHGAFANDRGLRPAEKSLLMAWIDAGTPRGEGTDPLPSAQPAPNADWPLGRPDHVVSLPEAARIPATGLVPYQTFTVKAPVTADAWLRGVTLRPGNARVVHHCLVFVRYPEALRHREPPQDEGTAGFFAGFVPGSDPVMFPAGTGKFLPQGSEFVFQMHYTTTGREETDRTEMALYLAPEPPASELVTAAVATGDFEVPPGVRMHPVRAEIRLEEDTWLHEFTPHMHLRGSRAAYTAIYPDGREEVLLSVPAYDFNWQTLYRLKVPLRVPAGTRLVCSGAFDNSASNPANPDPGATVRFGEQTQDEMFIGYFNYARAVDRK